MAFTAGKGYKVKIDSTEVGTFLTNVSQNLTKDALETTTFQDGSRDFIEGLKGGTISLQGRWDGTAATNIDNILYTAYNNPATQPVIKLNPTGTGTFSPTAPGYSATCIVTAYESSASFDGVVSFTATLQISGDVSRLVGGTY